ncbi:MAG: DUF1579 domain-containing protein [Actinobacteria bacterium]|nr:DUF1579 domain-containing protein [Actinomycetota bacterium]
MDQPAAEKALKELEPLVGEWTLEAIPPGREPWPGGAGATIGWHDSGAHLVQRSTVEMPEAPNGVSIMGCDAANGTYYQLYSDGRGVCRVYEMSIGDGEWRLWRGGRALPPALHRQIRGRRQHDRRPLGEGRGQRGVRDRLRPDLSQGDVSPGGGRRP